MQERLVLQNLFGPDQNFDALPWKPFRPGVEIVRLFGEETGTSTALLRYAKGASVPRHEHAGIEHIIVLRGSQRDDRGTYTAGTCVIHREETSHGITSDEGCVVLAIWQAPVRFT